MCCFNFFKNKELKSDTRIKNDSPNKTSFTLESPSKNRMSMVSDRDYETEIKNLKIEILDLQNRVKLKDIIIKEKETEKRTLSESEFSDLKSNFLQKDGSDFQEQLNISSISSEKRSKTTNNSSLKKIAELTEQLRITKKELDALRTNQSLSANFSENEISKLSIENENLRKKLKDLQDKHSKTKISNENGFVKEINELKIQNKQLETSLQETLEKLHKNSVFLNISYFISSF